MHRELYDYMLAVGEPWKNQDAEAYLKLAHKKYARLKRITERFVAEQPGHLDAHEFSDGGEVVGGRGAGNWRATRQCGVRNAECGVTGNHLKFRAPNSEFRDQTPRRCPHHSMCFRGQ